MTTDDQKRAKGELPTEALPQVVFCHPSDPQATVEVVDIAGLRSRVILDHSIFRPHCIDFFQLLVGLEGEGRHWVDFEAHTVNSGTVLQCRPGQVHWYDPSSDFEGLVLIFPGTGSALRLPPPRWPVRLELPTPDFELLVSMLKTLLAVEDGLRYTSRERVRRLLLPPILEIAEGASLHALDAGHDRQPKLEAFEMLVEEHHGHHRHLGWYARQLGCSVRTLTRHCKALTGRSAKQTIDERVVLEAKRRLTADTVSVGALAHDLGFSEATNFVKFFRRRTGVTPASFRQNYESLVRD